MRKNKLFLLLALLMTAATGAWADETLLVTINSTDYESFTSGSKTFDDKVTVTFSNWVENEGDADGWYTITSGSLLTVAGTNGYTITSCKFYTDNGAANGYTVEGESPSVYLNESTVYTDASKSVKIGDPGITKIEVYTAAASGSGSGEEAQTAKHLIKATYDKQTRLLEQPLPYATTIGELYEAVTGKSISDLISTMSAVEMPLTGISSNNTSVVSIGELNGASTPVTVNADGKATININFSGYHQAIFVSAISPLYAYVKDGVKDDYEWTAKVGDGEAQALPIGGLKGDGSETVTLQYNGRLKVKGVKATSDAVPGPFDNVTASDKGKVIGADGKIYADATAATAASTTAVAMIAYVGNDAETNTKYNHGLAIALTDASTAAKWDTNTNRYCLSPFSSADAAKGDMAGIANTDAIVKDGHTHAAASAARNYNSGTHPDGTSEWFLPSAGQWDKMITAAEGGAVLRTKAGLASDAYWSSSESSLIDYRAWQYNFSSNGLYNSAKTDEKHVRAVLAF